MNKKFGWDSFPLSPLGFPLSRERFCIQIIQHSANRPTSMFWLRKRYLLCYLSINSCQSYKVSLAAYQFPHLSSWDTRTKSSTPLYLVMFKALFWLFHSSLLPNALLPNVVVNSLFGVKLKHVKKSLKRKQTNFCQMKFVHVCLIIT